MQLGLREVAGALVSLFHRGTQPNDSFMARAYLCQAQLAAPATATTSVCLLTLP